MVRMSLTRANFDNVVMASAQNLFAIGYHYGKHMPRLWFVYAEYI